MIRQWDDIRFALLQMDKQLFGETNEEKARRIRRIGRAEDGSSVPAEYGSEDLGGISTHLMAHTELDGRFFAFPTLFPGYHNEKDEITEEWTELDIAAAFEEAKKRDELFEFSNINAAADFARGSWKSHKTDPLRTDTKQGEYLDK